MQAQIEVVPAPAHERNAAISPFLSEVVATLMAKRAEERFESAAALRRTLAAAEDSPWWKVRATQVARAALRVPRIPVERATASYGRKDELDALNEAWASARGGVGGVVWIEGEAGIGKSRLLDEFVRGLGDGRRHVLYGAFPAAGGLRGVTEAIVDHFGEGDLGGRLRPHLEAYADLVPAFAARMRDECPPSGAAPLPPEALPTLTARLLQSLAEDAPVLWMVDDAHLAREEGARLLTALARATENRRVLLVVTSHEGRLAEGAFAALAALPTLRRLSLRRLGARDVVLLLTEALQSELLAESLGGRIAAKSDGVPLFVLEVIRALGEGGILKRAADGSYVQARRITSFAVPSSVRGLVETRLKGLSDDDRELLDVAAVQGPDFDAALVARVLDLKPVLALRRLAVLERRTGMIRASGARYRFDQKQVQETLYEELPQELRQEYHALLAEAHRQERGDRVEGRDAYFLAANHLQGRAASGGLAVARAGPDLPREGPAPRRVLRPRRGRALPRGPARGEGARGAALPPGLAPQRGLGRSTRRGPR